jgi:hypothetical protein
MQLSLTRTALCIGIVLLVVPSSTRAQDPVIKPSPTSVSRLPAPRTVVGRQLPDGRIEVRWARIEGASGYAITRSVPNLGSGRISPDPMDTVYVDYDVRKGYTYYYVVQGIDEGGGVGLKAGSNAVLANVSADTPPRVAPTVTAGIRSRTATSLDIGVSWSPVAGAMSYEVQRLEYRSASPSDSTSPDLTKPPTITNLEPTTSTSKSIGSMPPAHLAWWSFRITPQFSSGVGAPGVSNAIKVGTAVEVVGVASRTAPITGSATFVALNSITLGAGATQSLAVTAGGAGTRWISMNDSIVTVDAGGSVTGRKSGTTYIVALLAGADGSLRTTVVRVTVGP